MTVPANIAIAWDAYLDSGRNITDPVFVRCVQAFSEDDRWVIIRGVPALTIAKEWARFRLGCLQVWAAKRDFYACMVDAGGRSIGDTYGALVAGEIGVKPVSDGAIALYNAERHHWCGMIGRPKDDELLWIRRHLDTPYRNPWPQRRLSRAWWFYDDKWDIRAYWNGTRARMIATLDRWESVTDEERAKWARRDRQVGLGSEPAWVNVTTTVTLKVTSE